MRVYMFSTRHVDTALFPLQNGLCKEKGESKKYKNPTELLAAE